jgi:hypothetical protein
MTWQNSPSAAEFYGYLDELDLGPEEDDEAESDEETGRPGSAVFFSDTRPQALKDGLLVDVSNRAKEADIRAPVALTRAVWAQYVAVPQGVECQDEEGRLWDILGMFRQYERGDLGNVWFRLHVRNDNRAGVPPLVTLKAVWGPDENGLRCLTVMLPEED